jgi:regulator of protease activity HflC (stomatin/prohibitin superfamily)
MTTEPIIDRTEIEMQINPLAERAMSLKVIDDNSLMIADSIQTECRKMRQYIEEKYKKIKRPIMDSLDNVRNMEKADLARVVPLEDHLKSEGNAYKLEQKRIREAEEARLLKEAEAREEQERLERAAEIEKEAAKLKASGNIEEAAEVQKEAEQVLATPAYVPPPRMAPAPKTKNTMRMIVDNARLQTIADMLTKGTTKTPPSIPGVRFYQKWEYVVENSSAVPDTYRRPS